MKLDKISFKKKVFFACASIISMLLILQSIVLYIYITDTVNKSSLKDSKELASRINQQMDFKIKELNNISEGLINNEEFKLILKSGAAASQMQYLEFDRKIASIMNTLNTPSIIAKRIIVFKEDEFYYFTGKGTAKYKEVFQRISRLPWKSKLLKNKGEKMVMSTHEDDWSSHKEYCFSVARNIIDQNGKIIGSMEVQQDYSQLKTICTIDSKIGSVIVFDHEGALVYPYNENANKFQDVYNCYSRFSSSKDQKSGSITHKNSDNESDIYAYSKSPYTRWVVFIKISKDSYSCGTKSVLIFNIGIILFLTLGFILVVLNITTSYILKPLRELTESVNNVSIDNLSILLEPFEYGENEITYLNNAFKVMFTDLNKSIAHLLESRTNEAKAQILALQSQMNPHFVYNTISTIESLSYLSGNKKVAELCNSFSSMLKYVSDFRKDKVTLREELDYIRDYLILMESRYEEHLKYEINVDESALGLIIPKLIIQPLVENSIEHGVFKVNPPWHIRIDLDLSNESLIISVSDNGCGVEDKEIEQIRTVLDECDKRMNKFENISALQIGGLAIANIYTRLKLLYSDSFTINFENLKPTGFKVTIIILDIIKNNQSVLSEKTKKWRLL